MQDQNESNFLDPRTILAVVLVAVVWFGWQSYLGKKYPQTEAKREQQETVLKQNPAKEIVAPVVVEKDRNVIVEQAEKTIEVTADGTKFLLSSNGMGIKSLTLEKYSDRQGNPVRLGSAEDHGLFEMALNGEKKPIPFVIQNLGNNKFEGEALIGSMRIKRALQYDPENYLFKNQISIESPSKEFSGFSITLPERRAVEGSKSFLMPSFDKQELVVNHSGKYERISLNDGKEDSSKEMTGVTMLGLGTQYFASAVVDKSEVIPEFRVENKLGEKDILSQLIYKPASSGQNMTINFLSFAGPKSFDQLKKIDKELANIVDYGMFSSIAEILLDIMKWFYRFVGNWGFAIILLTVLVRILVLPFNVASYRSMQKMKNIQPAMQSLRERYKDDSQTLNREMMILMKDQKVNPLGGCLPMLLQMPVFFALYQVLGHSIELYKAPFMWWIHDLSLKDPFYVLPVLMGITFWIQQKMTPTTMDPAQAKVMQFMPVIFSVMMISLPSGLTLYIFISTLFGVIQQQIFMKTHSQTPISGGK